MADVFMADVIMADAPPVKRQRGDAVSVVFDHPIFSSFPLASKTWYVEERDTAEDLKVWVQLEVISCSSGLDGSVQSLFYARCR